MEDEASVTPNDVTTALQLDLVVACVLLPPRRRQPAGHATCRLLELGGPSWQRQCVSAQQASEHAQLAGARRRCPPCTAVAATG